MKLVNKRRKGIALFLLLIFLFQICLPLQTFALTGGPSQPEVQSFEPVGTTDMVDLSTGDFNYNIPLLDVEGYPINISYHSGVSMDQEASWVGVGWNINPGVINRNMRGLPDDFKGDEIKQQYDSKPHKTWGVIANLGLEALGFDLGKSAGKNKHISFPFSLGVKSDNFRGMGLSFGVTPTLSVSKGITENKTGEEPLKIGSKKSFGLDLNFDSQDGFSADPSYSVQNTYNSSAENNTVVNKSVSLGFSSRGGFKGLTLSTSTSLRDKEGKQKGLDFNKNGGSFLTQNHPSYQPSSKTPSNIFAFQGNFKMGLELIGLNGEVDLKGYFSFQQLKDKLFTRKGYGSMYNLDKKDNGFVQDFNRYNESSYSKSTLDLPLSTLTYDYFAVSGQGISGAYRAKQSYVPIVYDDEVNSYNTQVSLGGELGAGNLFKLGINAGVVFTSSRNGVKKLTDDETKYLDIKRKYYYKPFDFEENYFKYVGEKTPVEQNFYSLLGSKEAIIPKDFTDYVKNNSTHGKAVKEVREKRNQVFQYLTASQIDQASNMALDYSINSYTINSLQHIYASGSYRGVTGYSRSIIQPQHHISEITVLGDDGRRYVYGLPVMNNSQTEYTFSVDNNSAKIKNQLVNYPKDGDGKINYHKTDSKINYSYHEQQMPKYAHSFLLTGLLSDDYIDRGGNGITDDDYGTAVKFNYTKILSDYQWRSPYGIDTANYQPGFKSNPNDNKANFVYGTKEIWYMHSVETKNFVAVFILSDRADGLGVTGRDGGKDTTDKLKKLDRIVLYSKTDIIANGSLANGLLYVVPIKTVHFEYDYSTCPNVDNNIGHSIMVNGTDINLNKGKLTLKKIFFTYGNSNKGMYTSYRFGYSTFNPSYNIKSYDRWGNYSPLSNGDMNTPNNGEWPFVNQTKSTADTYASAWNLNKIELPTGGVISVTYESDDYAYVQDRPAQQMIKIVDIGETKDSYVANKPRANLYQEHSDHKHYNCDYLFVKLPPNTSGGSVDVASYLRRIDELFFNINTVVRKDYINGAQPIEDINGFCKIAKNESGNPDCGLVTGQTDIAWIKVQEVSIRDNDEAAVGQDIQPMAKQAFIFAVQNLPEQVYPGSDPNATGESAWRGMLTSFKEMTDIFKTFYKRMRDKSYCQEVVLGKSYIRLNATRGKKFGGGCRVQKIELDDKWDQMKNSTNSHVTNSVYGQKYNYTTISHGDTISSGVAQWEPSVGGEENPFRQPKWEIQKRYMGRDEKIMHVEPVAEAFYPSPSVGYSEVTVESLGGKTGKTVTEFYTAKDFPTRVYRTDLIKNSTDNGIYQAGAVLANAGLKAGSNALSSIGSGFGVDLGFDFLHATQGYTIVNNDMHGKMYRQSIYPQNSNIYKSRVVYKYKTSLVGTPQERSLNNRVLTYDYTTNQVNYKTVGVDYDMTYDKQAEQTITASASGNFNNDDFLSGPLPVPALSFFLNFGFQMNDFKYTVDTKVINQYAVLEGTEVFEDGSTINTKNLLYDDKTGEVLLTETQNEFNDKIYNLTYPAHFTYDGMGQAYRNLNIELSGLRIQSDGGLYASKASDDWKLAASLLPGDEVLISGFKLNGGTAIFAQKAWVHKLRSGAYCLLEESGNILKDYLFFDLKVIRSGRRNMQNIPVGGLTLLTNPLVFSSGEWHLNIDSGNVLNVSAVTFSDQWQTLCESAIQSKCTKETDAGRGIKLWLYEMVKHRGMMTNSDFASDDSIPNDIFKSIKFCDTSSTGSGYVIDTGNLHSSGDIGYIIRNAEHDTCCRIYLTSKYMDCKIHHTNTYIICFPSNHITFRYNGVDSLISSLVPERPDSIVTSDTCAYDGVYMVDTCHNYDYVYSIKRVSEGVFNSIAPTYSSGGQTIMNYLYKYAMPWDSVACDFLRFDSINAESVFPVSVDTAKFQYFNSIENFTIEATLNNGIKVWLESAIECKLPLFKDCCTDCAPPATKVINPYLEAVRGVWRKKADYAFHAKRNLTFASSIADPKLRKDGVFDAYHPFWEYSSVKNCYLLATGTNWQKANEVTSYNPFGNEIENKDALGIYSAALFGYNYRLPVAVAKNAKYTQLAYDGFENYGLFGTSDCAQSHWSFEWSHKVSVLDDTKSHSGNYSLKIPANDTEMVARKVVNCTNTNNGTERDEYILGACNCIQKFSPDTGMYLIGGWLREKHDSTQAITDNYTHAKIIIMFKKNCNDSFPIIDTFKADGPVIEEWQRVEASFHVPEGYPLVEVYLNAPLYDAWFDDLRIHPYMANMKTYAYDKRSLRLMAELDENNFATFYEYDLEGQLMRVKKETIKGIVTLKEVRNHSSTR